MLMRTCNVNREPLVLGLTTPCESWQGKKPKGKLRSLLSQREQPRATLRAVAEQRAEALTCMVVGVLPAAGSAFTAEAVSPWQRLTGQRLYLSLQDPVTAQCPETMASTSPACGEER